MNLQKSPTLRLAVLAGIALSSPAFAAVIQFDISPNAGALSTTNYLFGQDHAVGLSGLNESPQNFSPASGGEVGPGISYDMVTNLLSFSFAYGSAFGFTDLTAPYTVSHIHGALSGPDGLSNFPAPNTNAGVLFNLAPFHIPFTPLSGLYNGTLLLTEPQETALMQNRFYINIHSLFRPGGEIRGQLVAVVPEPSAALLSLAAAGLGLRRRR